MFCLYAKCDFKVLFATKCENIDNFISTGGVAYPSYLRPWYKIPFVEYEMS